MTSHRMRAIAIALLALTMCHAAPKPPVWPDELEVQYTITLPYVSSVQPVLLKYPVHIWFNKTATLMRVSFYDGLDDVYVTPEATYYTYPRITTRSCLVIKPDVGPTLGGVTGLLGEEEFANPLPDISGWQYGGPSRLEGKPPTDAWQFTMRAFEKVATYTFHVTQKDKAPVRLDMLGTNLFTGSHFDQYVVDFDFYIPSLTGNNRPFTPPKALCDKAKSVSREQISRAMSGQVLGLLPTGLVPPATPASATTSGSPLTSVTERLRHLWQSLSSQGQPKSALHATIKSQSVEEPLQPGVTGSHDSTVADNLALIREWNAQREQRMAAGKASGVAAVAPGPVAAQDAHMLSANKFVTWSDERWRGTVLGHMSVAERKRAHPGLLEAVRKSPAYLGTFKRRLTDAQLPKSVDWRGTGADGPVKDQASCGSCWTFAATGAMTGAWYAATNQSLSFSEQQLVDCTWDYVCPEGGCGGCWGGWIEPALQYVSEHGIALEARYPYKGQNSMCRPKTAQRTAKFKGFMNVPTKDEKALMEAVATYGPVGISFDAVHPTFKFYSEGVYYREDCGNDADHLNHAVTLVGYGTTPSGTDYWLLRNSWSQYWGDGGYFKMARKGNDCGVTVDAVVAVVDEHAAARARAEAGAEATVALS